jgi:hypothetical protein
MLRRTSPALFKRTPARLSGAAPPPMYNMKAYNVPDADLPRGILYLRYKGPAKILRVFDFKWWLNRQCQLDKDGLFGGILLSFVVWNFVWRVPQYFLWGERSPPRIVDWNKGKAGYLPEDFQFTPVK